MLRAFSYCSHQYLIRIFLLKLFAGFTDSGGYHYTLLPFRFSEEGITKGTSMKRIITITVVLALPLLISACNTLAGAGQDVSATGNAVSSTAEKTKNDM
jgi:predicted small secreted protein